MGIDLVGSGEKIVAVVEIEKEPKKDIKEVAEGLMKENRNVKTVLEKVSGTKGNFRMKEQRLVLGDEDTEVVHKENGYLLKLDPRKVYFSPREATIRKYVSMQVQPKERILVMMAGVGPYAMCIARFQPEVGEVVAVELNPDAVRYMEENIRMNKISHLVTPIEGDVNEACKGFKEEFDRVIIPMRDAKDFLGLAARCAKRSGMIHVYMISDGKDLFKDAREAISDILKKIGRQYEIKGEVKIGLYAPRKWKVLIEVKLK